VSLALDRPLQADADVVIGYPSMDPAATELILGPGALLRSGTVIYEGSEIGGNLQTGHNVVIRENSTIGEDVSIWSNSVIDYGCVIGSRVKIHCNCYIAQYTEIEDDVFLAPGVTIANDLFPGVEISAAAMQGPRIGAGAQIGVNVTILPYVTIGEGAMIGSGAVVTRDIPAGAVAYGSPAVPVKRVADLDVEGRLARSQRPRLRPQPPAIIRLP
jgi:acetyltransferase-like isoleucine patch superfamily enzyme